jgi:hypothetical protein
LIEKFFADEPARVVADVYRARKLAKSDTDVDVDNDQPVDQDKHRLEAAITAALLAVNLGLWAVSVAPLAPVLTDLHQHVR